MSVEEQLKICCRCKTPMRLHWFNIDNKRKDKRNPVCKLCRSMYTESKCITRSYYNKEYFKTDNGRYTRYKYNLMYSYGITEEQFRELLDETRGCCPVCMRGLSYRKGGTLLVIDHNHKTGKIRGILCSDCNSSLGKIGDSIHGLRRLHKYLLKSGEINEQL